MTLNHVNNAEDQYIKSAWDDLRDCELECRVNLRKIGNDLKQIQKNGKRGVEYHDFEKPTVPKAVIDKIQISLNRFKSAQINFLYSVSSSQDRSNIEEAARIVTQIEKRLHNSIERLLGLELPLEPWEKKINSILYVNMRIRRRNRPIVARIWGRLDEDYLSRHTYAEKNLNELRKAIT